MIEIVEAIEDEVEELVEEKSEVQPAAQAPGVNRALAAEIANDVLSRIAQPSAQRVSALRQTVNDMLDEGVPEIAIKRILKLNEAAKADEQVEYAAQAQMQAAKAFDQGCWQIAQDQFEDYIKNIPILANARNGLKGDLLQEVSDTIASDPDPGIASIRTAVAEKRFPDRHKVGKVVAKVIDSWLAENGMTKKSAPQDLKNSKVTPPAAAINMDDMSKGARQIYAQVLKHTGDEQKAMKRARDLDAGK